MTRTERAWELFVELFNSEFSKQYSDSRSFAEGCFTAAENFEAEAARHEEPKAEGDALYALAWNEEADLIIDELHREKYKAVDEVNEQNAKLGLGEDPYFLVEVRRVK